MEKELTDLEKLDLLYEYAKGKIKDLNAKAITYSKAKHYNNTVIVIYNKNKIVDIIDDATTSEIKAKLEIQYPNASITSHKHYNSLKGVKLRFGKHFNKTLDEIKTDKSYFKYCLNKIPTLTSDYKLHFSLLLNHEYIYSQNLIFKENDEISMKELIFLYDCMYVSEKYGLIFIKNSNIKENVKFCGNIIEREGLNFYEFV